MNKRENENWLWIKERLGNKCARCGCTVNLQIDHKDPCTKKFEVKSRLSYKRVNLIEEVDKCQLLCKPCHKDKTYNEDWDLILKKKKEFIHVEHNFYPLFQETWTDITIDLHKKDGAAYYKIVKLIAKHENKTIEEVVIEMNQLSTALWFYSTLEDWDKIEWNELSTEEGRIELKKDLEEYIEEMKNKNPELYEKVIIKRENNRSSMTEKFNELYRLYDESN